MGDQCPVFITATKPNIKKVNKTFVLLLDYEYDTNPEHQIWSIITSKDASLAKATPPTLPPLKELNSDFEGWSLDQLYDFMSENEEVLGKAGFDVSSWAMLDDEALENDTVLLVEHNFELDEDEEDEEEREARLMGNVKYKAVRAPAEEAHTVFVNLQIANMGFEDFVNEEAGHVNGVWQYISCGGESNEGVYSMANDATKEQDEAIKKGQEEGWLE